jgi:MFS family permease
MSALRHRRFRRLWLAGLISDTGDWLLLVSLPIVVYQYTGSTIGTAVAFLVQLAPSVLLAPLAGRVADRPDRGRVLVVISLAQAAAVTPLLAVTGRSGLALLYAVLIVQAALACVFDPTKNALLPTLVGDEQLVSANSLVGLNQNIGRLIGGSLGGVLLAAGGGPSLIVAADGASFLMAAALIASAGTPAAAATSPADHPARRAPARWTSVLSSGPLRASLLVVLIASVAQGIFVVLFLVFVARILHGSVAEIGLLRGVQAIGAIAAGGALALAVRVRPPALTAWAAIAFGVVDLAIWNAPHLTAAEPLYVALFIVAGAPGVALATGLTSLVQQVTREGERGAAFAALGAAMAVGEAAGMLAAGALGDRLGILAILNAQGALYVVAGLLAARSLGRRTARPRAGREPPPAPASAHR